MIKIAFVCLGNICRSPMAEFILKDIAKKSGKDNRFHIESRATSTEEIFNGIGNPIYPPAQNVLKNHNIAFDAREATQVSKNDYEKFDYFICMDSSNLNDTLRIFGADPENKVLKLMDFTDKKGDVSDPWFTRDFDKAYSDIRLGCEKLFEKLLNE